MRLHRSFCHFFYLLASCLVGGLVAIFYFPIHWLVAIFGIFPFILGIIWNVIIPIDELMFFRGVAQPPTSFRKLCLPSSLRIFLATSDRVNPRLSQLRFREKCPLEGLWLKNLSSWLPFQLGGELPTNRLGGLVDPSYKWTNPTYPIYNQGYNPLTIRGMNHQVKHVPCAQPILNMS